MSMIHRLAIVCFLIVAAAARPAFAWQEPARPMVVPPSADQTPLPPETVIEEPEPPGPTTQQRPVLVIPAERIRWHVADPEEAKAYAREELAKLGDTKSQALRKYYTSALERLGTIMRPDQLHLTLEDALGIALANNYEIATESYSPAIDTARLVQAEAAFDSVFFFGVNKNKIDRPSASQLSATSADVTTINSGVRKLLATGTEVGFSYNMVRNESNLAFQTLNPAYTSNVAIEVQQPFLRDFGLDYNRSVIKITRNDRKISDLAFQRRVRDTLRETEERYWRVVQARRNVVITVRLLSDFETIKDNLEARRTFDITPVQISATDANLEASKAEFVQVRANLFDAEDRLIAVMNGERINLADDIEIIPDDFMHTRLIVVDPLGEVQAALDHRPELKEQDLRVQSARIAVGRAKNQELPRLDATFRYTIDGLDSNADAAFDQVTQHNFVEYFVGVEFQMPIGNRGPRAATLQAMLQQTQAMKAMKALFENVIFEVNIAVRRLNTGYDQIAPSFKSAEAREREVESIVARAERKDINTLNSELNARQALAGARRAMLEAMVEYNVAIINLEWAKGTLLPYNDVVIPTERDPSARPAEAEMGAASQR